MPYIKSQAGDTLESIDLDYYKVIATATSEKENQKLRFESFGIFPNSAFRNTYSENAKEFRCLELLIADNPNFCQFLDTKCLVDGSDYVMKLESTGHFLMNEEEAKLLKKISEVDFNTLLAKEKSE